MVKYYNQGEWRDGVVISPSEWYKDVKSGEKRASREWGNTYSYIKVKKRKDGGYIVYGVPKKSKDKFYGKFLLVNLDTNESLGKRSVFVEEVTKGEYEGGSRYYISKGKKIYLYPYSSIVRGD